MAQEQTTERKRIVAHGDLTNLVVNEIPCKGDCLIIPDWIEFNKRIERICLVVSATDNYLKLLFKSFPFSSNRTETRTYQVMQKRVNENRCELRYPKV